MNFEFLRLLDFAELEGYGVSGFCNHWLGWLVGWLVGWLSGCFFALDGCFCLGLEVRTYVSGCFIIILCRVLWDCVVLLGCRVEGKLDGGVRWR